MKKLLSILLALSMLLSLAPGAFAEGAPEGESPAGCYKLTGMTGSTGSNLEIVSTIVEMGVKYYLILNEDGSGSMKFLEAEIPLSWDGECINIEGKAPVSIPYSCDDGAVDLNTKAYSLSFSALSEEEQAYYEANGSGSLSGILGKLVEKLTGGMEGGLLEGLLFDLALGMSSYEPEAIPESEPSEGPVSGLVDGMEFAVLGAEAIAYEGTDYIVFWYDATNRGDSLCGVWTYESAAAQDGAFLDESWELDDLVPEHYNVNYELWPGASVRCANVYPFDPDGGTVGLRLSTYSGSDAVLYYADPQDLSGAPEEPFVFGSGFEIPAEWEAQPEETENIRIEGVEAFTTEDGEEALRFYYRYLNVTDESDLFNYYGIALQDGVELRWIWEDDDPDAEQDDTLFTHAYLLRTDSPVAFLVLEETWGEDTVIEAAKIVELG